MKLTDKIKEAVKPLDKAFDDLMNNPKKKSKSSHQPIKKPSNDKKLAKSVAKRFDQGSKNPLSGIMGMGKAKVTQNKDGTKRYKAQTYNNELTVDDKNKLIIVHKVHKTDPDYFDIVQAADKMGYKVKKG